jgi:hypothetical protein
MVGQGATTTVVTLPAMHWDGNFANQSASVRTAVSLEAFGDLMEGIVTKIHGCALAGDLQILLTGGSDELVSRYMFGARIA